MVKLNISEWTYWAYSGVDFNIPGTGGESCTNYLPYYQRIAETAIFLLIALFEMRLAFSHLSLETLTENGIENNKSPNRCTGYIVPKSAYKQLLLVVLSITFGIELGFKLASKQFIWILNPCHILTMIQIYLLAASPSRWTTLIFRIQIHLLNGAMIAVCFPVINTRLLPFEVTVYWVQHLLLLLVPIYLMSLGAPYTVERLSDFSWPVFVLGLQQMYHFILLQGVSMMTGVNLNNIVCPAVSDPFNGPFYRMWAVLHQSALILIHGKAYVYLASVFGIPTLFTTHLIYEKSSIS